MRQPDLWPNLPLRIRDLLLILVLALGAVAVAGVLLVGWDLSVALISTMLVLQAAITLGAIYFVAVMLRGARLDQLGIRAAPRRWYSRAVLTAILLVPLVFLINAGVQTLTGEPFRNAQLNMIAPDGFSWSAAIAMVLITGIAVPIAEETAFRGLLYGWLRQRFGVVLGVLGSAALFSLAHGALALIPVLAVQGVVLALLYEKSRSLWPPIITHGLCNAAMIILLYAALGFGVSVP